MLFKRFDVTATHVTIDDDVIPRPAYISAGQWIEFWETARDEVGYQSGYEDAEENYKDEIKELTAEIDDLAGQISALQREASDADAHAQDMEDRADKEYERGYKDGLNDGRQGV